MSTNASTNFVKNWILEKIQTAELKPGDAIPNEFEIKKLLNINYDEIEKAIHELVTEQILSQKTGDVTVVKPTQPYYYPLDELVSITKMIEKNGEVAGTEFISLDEEVATLKDIEVLNLEKDASISVIERVRTANGEPVVYCLDKIATDLFACSDYRSNSSILSAIESKVEFKITHANTSIESISYEPYISEILNSEPDDAMMLLTQVHYNEHGTPVLYSLNYFKSSLVKFRITRNRI
ncbi:MULTISPECIES: GntR family transcriptional regulator [Mammaliicoccus]|jgi:DNA-binding GntR family transcriptional regulator|uniref:GntR family transcriptional regulator n=1 Tax=Mammaliicoccus sciuri TaxID=1296 RepID=A0AAW5LKV6_MAMSC|nr:MULTISPECIES: GntR family transcriptional regulator [Mammaliicoccus]KTT84787.1 transcriptional regulator [Mammaliicoccus sciuri]MBA1396302.1 UTRA domain-containing protein [Mammaliicoccus sciuri]MBF0718902.1 GntR family transcriptional regulator [Mammaliicoccus sciuri]MBF0773397.1 GntR family transcriptional regulator [Mammaliicoccus sciuri]MBG9205357.1 GntR family transcriptional regulator [Mammaliicoccus sciuri]